MENNLTVTKAIPSTISKVTTMGGKTVRVQIDTQELNAEDMKTIFDLYDKYGYFVFAETSKTELLSEFENLPKIKTTDKKSPSQRLRAVLFVLFKQDGITGEFEDFYNTEMNKLIDIIKSKLEPR